jgi:hypothetical protein
MNDANLKQPNIRSTTGNEHQVAARTQYIMQVNRARYTGTTGTHRIHRMKQNRYNTDETKATYSTNVSNSANTVIE